MANTFIIFEKKPNLIMAVNLNLGLSNLIATVIFGDELPFNLRLNSSGLKKN